MRNRYGFGRWMQVVVAATALAVAAGCGSDDDQSAPPSVAGEYAAEVPLDGEGVADVEIFVEEDDSASGVVLLPDDAGAAAALSGSNVISVSVLGTADRLTGAFELTGSFVGEGGPINVRLTGVLPGPGRTGTVTLEVGDRSYTAPLDPVAAPTPTFTLTPLPGSTPTATSPQTGATPTAGTGATATPGVIGGISSDMLGVWSGEARNDTTGTRLNARLRIEVSGGNVVVTDLNGNIFPGNASINMDVRSETTLSYNAFGPPVVVFTLNLTSPSTLIGLHGVTTTSFPPMITSLALDLTPEG